MQRVLPSLTAEFHVPEMIPFVLPNVLMIAEECNNAQYEKLIFPALIPVFKIQSPVQVGNRRSCRLWLNLWTLYNFFLIE